MRNPFKKVPYVKHKRTSHYYITMLFTKYGQCSFASELGYYCVDDAVEMRDKAALQAKRNAGKK